ncbi:hypothetical protein HYH03_007831 [Edaphochlamys debaryana]|uniref:Protein kinase domain-containing protein n=1 Tax=Edaphochlamys debaryana TaxID=47281 RepID=A0A835YAC8_9CHLO|nr:hypothetical protein HYH03_007831 [Edaphochlamys debaryana]|eukprot:KAG2493894.1 hypothetical protein HYH03_007831 [Edaphochlamys debaryana]
MGQCLSSDNKAPASSAGASPAAPSKAQEKQVQGVATFVPLKGAGNVTSAKDPEVARSTSSFSDATSTQQSGVNSGTAGTGAVCRTGAAAKQEQQTTRDVALAGLKEDAETRAPQNGHKQHATEIGPGSLSELSTCVKVAGEVGAPNPPTEEEEVDTEFIVGYGGCAGPVTRREIDMNQLKRAESSLENGRQGLPHDVVQYGAPLPANEIGRMATVRALRGMAMGNCPELDLICKMICRVWDAPAACVTLLDSDHVFICSGQGMTATHRPWAIAMCPWMLLTPHPTAMAIGDLTRDARFSKSLHVRGGTRSYLTSPLVASNGHRLGAICFTDTKPRRFDAGDCRLMNNCAELAVRALEAHLRVSKRLGLPAPRNRASARASAYGSPRASTYASPRASDAAGSRRALAELPAAASGVGDLGEVGGRLARDLEEDDGALMEEYRNRVRDMTEVDESVVLLVDTGAPGWPVLYASANFGEVTGVDRAEALGATLNELMAHVNGDPRVVWEGVEREAAAGKPFVTPRVHLRAAPACTFYLSFRPSTTDDLDEQTVTMGVPASVPQVATSAVSRLFFARLHTTPDPPANSRMQTHSSTAILTTGRRLPPTVAINPVHGLTELYAGLQIGQVLGQGSYGTVYHAKWHGVDVAVKVQDMHIRSAEERARAEFEVGLGQRLHHVNVVHTLAHASALLERSGDTAEVLESGGSSAWNAGLQFCPMGMLVATGSQASVSRSHGDSRSPSQANVDLGPAFLPFFTAADGDAAAAAAAAAQAAIAAARAAAAAGEVAAATAAASSDANALAAAAAAAVANASRSGPSRRVVSQSQNTVPLAALLAANASGSGQKLPLLDLGSNNNNALIRVALPSGAQVPMLRQQRTSGLEPSGTISAAAGRNLHAFLPDASGGGGGGTSTAPVSQLSSQMSAGSVPTMTNLAVAMASRGSSNGAVNGFNGNGPGSATTAGNTSSHSPLLSPLPTLGSLAPGGPAAAAAAQLASAANLILGPPLHSGSYLRHAAAGGRAGANPTLGTMEEEKEADVRSSGAHAMPAPGAAGAAAFKRAQGEGLGGFLEGDGDEATDDPAAEAAAEEQQEGAGQDDADEDAGEDAPIISPFVAAPTVPGAGQGAGLAGARGSAHRLAVEEVEEVTITAGAKIVAIAPTAGSTACTANLVLTAGCGLEPDATGRHRSGGESPGAGLLGLSGGSSGGTPTHRPIWQTVGTAPDLDPRAGKPLALVRAGSSHGPNGVGGTMQDVLDADLSGLSYPLDVRLWMVLEFMDKGNLQDAIDRGWLREGRSADHGPDYPAVLATVQEIASSLAYLHSHDVVHGDLSAVNVLLQSVRPGQDGAPAPSDSAARGFIAKLSDFGLSMQLTRPDQAIKTQAYGTITHMAPEVLRDSTLSKAADVYSVGVLLWQMVTGSRPWAGLSHLQVSVEVGRNQRQLQWPTWVHSGVRALGQRMQSPKVRDRPTAAQLVAEVGVLLQQMPQYA